MVNRIEAERASNRIEIKFIGDFSISMLDEGMAAFVRLSNESENRCVLVDVQALDGSVGIFSQLRIVEMIQAKILPGTRMAFLSQCDGEQSGSFLETVARNRDFTLKVFNDRNSAASWLAE